MTTKAKRGLYQPSPWRDAMVSSTRWFGAAALGGLALFWLPVPQAQAQFRRAFPGALTAPVVNPVLFPNRSPIFVPALGTPGVGVNTMPFLNPFTTLNQAAFNTAVTGRA